MGEHTEVVLIPRGYAKAMFSFWHHMFASKFTWRPKKRNVETSRRKNVRKHG